MVPLNEMDDSRCRSLLLVMGLTSFQCCAEKKQGMSAEQRWFFIGYVYYEHLNIWCRNTMPPRWIHGKSALYSRNKHCTTEQHNTWQLYISNTILPLSFHICKLLTKNLTCQRTLRACMFWKSIGITSTIIGLFAGGSGLGSGWSLISNLSEFGPCALSLFE